MTSIVCFVTWLSMPFYGRANLPGGGTGTGANVTLTDSGTVVTLSNGIVSIPVTKASANIYAINYTHSNGTNIMIAILPWCGVRWRGRPMNDLKKEFHVSDSTLSTFKQDLATDIREMMGTDVLEAVCRRPRWLADVEAGQERQRCHYERRLSA